MKIVRGEKGDRLDLGIQSIGGDLKLRNWVDVDGDISQLV
jgi:hypothetical protein